MCVGRGGLVCVCMCVEMEDSHVGWGGRHGEGVVKGDPMVWGTAILGRAILK